jgi:hypothetical protein
VALRTPCARVHRSCRSASALHLLFQYANPLDRLARMLRNASNSRSPWKLCLCSRHPYRSPVQHRHQCIFQNISIPHPRGGLQCAKFKACPVNWDARGKLQERPGLQVLDSPVRALPKSTPAAPPAGRTAKAKPALQLSNSPFRPVSSFPPQKACHAVAGLASAHFLTCPLSLTHAAYPLPFSPILRDSNPTSNPTAQNTLQQSHAAADDCFNYGPSLERPDGRGPRH